MPDQQPPWEEEMPWDKHSDGPPPPRPQQQAKAPPPPKQKASPPLSAQVFEEPEYAVDGDPVFKNGAQMERYMQRLIDNKFFAPHINTPAKAIIAMGVCKAAGLPWMRHINATYFVHDRLAVEVKFMRAAAEATGKLVACQWKLLDDKGEELSPQNSKGFRVFQCEAYVHNSDLDDGQKVIYTLDMAAEQGILNRNPNYRKAPGDMLMWRALGRALMAQFHGCTGGAMAQGVHDDIEPVYDQDGRQMKTEGGQSVYRSKTRRKLDAVLAAKGSGSEAAQV